jgi:hypothetical protein
MQNRKDGFTGLERAGGEFNRCAASRLNPKHGLIR